MKTGYSVKIKETSRPLTAREKLKMTDTSDAAKLDEVTNETGVIVTPIGYCVLDIHNDKSDNKDYVNYIIEDKDGTKYVTGSDSFWYSFISIWSVMTESASDEEFSIKCYKLDSKNYKGKKFLTCTII